MTHCIYATGPIDQITCSSPDVAQWGTVNVQTCLTRCPYREEPKTGFFAATTQLAKIKSAKPAKKKKCGSCGKKKAKQKAFQPSRKYDGNGQWTVAVTTSPRRNCTLKSCLKSIVDAGWPEPIVFAEPGSTKTHHKTVANQTQLGVWHNWLNSVRWCLKNTDSEFILTVQDDSEFHPQSREFTESILWPSGRTGFVSLYTPKHYQILKNKTDRRNGINHIRTRSLWGACALVWHRPVLEAVIRHKIARTWQGVRPANPKTQKSVMAKRKANPSMIANSDTAIGKVLNSLQLQMWFVSPSPVSHIAVHSTIGHGGNKGRRNCYRCADPSVSLFDQIPRRNISSMQANRKTIAKTTLQPITLHDRFEASEKHYDEHYSKKGFAYTSDRVMGEIEYAIHAAGLNGKVLDAPSGDGCFSKAMRKAGLDVVSAELSQVGADQSNGVQWDLEQHNPEWVGKFDWVFSRAISHLHHDELQTQQTIDVFENLMTYAPKVLVILNTDQSETNPKGNHAQHSRETLDRFFSQLGNVESFFRGNYYHAILTHPSP